LKIDGIKSGEEKIKRISLNLDTKDKCPTVDSSLISNGYEV